MSDIRAKKQVVRILDKEKIDFLYLVANSELSDNEKAEKLFHLCNRKSLICTRGSYQKFPATVLKRVDVIIAIWDKLEELHLFDGYKKVYKCPPDEVERRLDKLVAIEEIFFSGLSYYAKAEKIYELYNSSEKFRRSNSLFIKFGEFDHRLDRARWALNHFDDIYHQLLEYEKNNTFINIRYLKSLEKELKVYPYARFVVSAYVNTKNSYRTSEFLDCLGTDSDVFDYCVDVIKELNGPLYEKYSQKKEKNVVLRHNYTLYILKELANGIKTGKMGDKPFNVLIFLQKIPFKQSGDFIRELFSFLRKNLPGEENTFYSYLAQNGIYNNAIFRELKLEKVNKTRTIVNGHEMTDEENAFIIDYLTANNYPVIRKTFCYVREMFLNGLIKPFTDEERQKINAQKMKKKCILIP